MDDTIFILDDEDDDELICISNSFIQNKSINPISSLNRQQSSTSAIKKDYIYEDDNDDILLIKEVYKTELKNDNISEADSFAIAAALNDLDNSLFESDLVIFYETNRSISIPDLHTYNEHANEISTLSIVDPKLETLDPNPDIYQLYIEFDYKYFDAFLQSTPLRIGWSNTFFTVAGQFQSHKDGFHSPTVLLSENLLSLRPRRDLVETLLHEMIHAYIYLKRIKDTNSHGVQFCKHMKRINERSGTNITIYHNFHAEVSALRKYVWRCNGDLCKKRRPYYGYVRLPTKRRPNRSDKPVRLHYEMNCSGTFIDISQNCK